MRQSGAKTLLMGGQACVFYGAAEFSRDLNLLVLTDPENLPLLQSALDGLQAIPIAVPDFHAEHLKRGHAIHFRCQRADVKGLRIDLMSSLRGVADFPELWDRRTTIEVEGEPIELLSLPDLVKAKKTQRDKDWPMISRLVQQSFFAGASSQGTTPVAAEFWFRELRTAELIIRLARMYPHLAQQESARPAVAAAILGHEPDVESALQAEELAERQLDRAFWEPLRKELEQFRRDRLKPGPPA